MSMQYSKHNQHLICGLGNPLLMDDAIGISIVRKLEEELDNDIVRHIDFIENHTGYLDLLDDFSEYSHILLIDSIETPVEKPGTLILCEPDDFNGMDNSGYVGIHGLNFPTFLKLGTVLGNPLPLSCTIAGITIRECKIFGIGLSKELESRIPELINRLKQFILKWIRIKAREVMWRDYRKADKEFGTD